MVLRQRLHVQAFPCISWAWSRVTPHRRQLGGTVAVRMLYTIALVLIILWLLGLVTSYTIGGFIHALIVIAVIMVLIRIIRGR